MQAQGRPNTREHLAGRRGHVLPIDVELTVRLRLRVKVGVRVGVRGHVLPIDVESVKLRALEECYRAFNDGAPANRVARAAREVRRPGIEG